MFRLLFKRPLSAYLPKSNAEHDLLQLKPMDMPENPRLLKVALLGAPNSGKSTIFNNLLGRKISAVSSRENTTRHRITGVFTDRDCQVVFLDTPGVFPPWKLKSNVRLEKSVLMDPQSSLWDADLVMLIHDAANKYTKYRITDELLMCLFAHPDKESVLVLNKVDMLKRKKQLLDITWRLTDGKLNGVSYMPMPGSEEDECKKKLTDPEWLFKRTDRLINEARGERKLLADKDELSELRELENEMMQYLGPGADKTTTASLESLSQLVSEKQSELMPRPVERVLMDPTEFQSDLMSTTNYHLFYQKLATASRFVKGATSWPYFNQVFMVSALKNDGLAELKRYLMTRCKPGDWWFHRDIMTDQYPQDIALMLIRQIMFEMLPQEIPYSLEMTVEKWYLDPDIDVLYIIVSIFPRRKAYSRDVGALLKNHGEGVKAIANAAQHALMDAFRCDVCLKLNVKLKPK